MSGDGWELAVDFGTTNSVGATRRIGHDEVREVTFDGMTELPSAVVAVDGSLKTGQAALNELAVAGGLRCPKRELGHGRHLLGDSWFTDADLVGAVIGAVATRASKAHDHRPPVRVVATHPVRWGRQRRQLLVEAVLAAGLPQPQLVSEPEAAASFYAHDRRPEGPVAVFDLGGGTLDTAVLVPEGDRWTLDAEGGDPNLGGEDIDDLLRGWVKQELDATREPELAGALFGQHDDDHELRAVQLRAQGDLRNRLRLAKHALSEDESATVRIEADGHSTRLTLRRETFDNLIDDHVQRAVQEMDETLQRSETAPGDLSALYLVGGSSYIRLVHDRLTQQLGLMPKSFDTLTTVVARGALYTLRPSPARQVPQGEGKAAHQTGVKGPSGSRANKERAHDQSASPFGNIRAGQHTQAVRRLLASQPQLQELSTEHIKFLEVLLQSDTRNVLALATMPELLDPNTIVPQFPDGDMTSIVSEMDHRRNVLPRPFPTDDGGSPPHWTVALFGHGIAAQLDELGPEIAAELRTPEAVWKLLAASEADYTKIESDPKHVGDVLARNIGTPHWISEFRSRPSPSTVRPTTPSGGLSLNETPSKKTPETVGEERESPMAILVMALGAIGLLILGVAIFVNWAQSPFDGWSITVVRDNLLILVVALTCVALGGSVLALSIIHVFSHFFSNK